jgi:hypothetical protein
MLNNYLPFILLINKLRNPLLLKLFLFKKLPLAFIAGLSVKRIEENICSVSIPFNWITSNPFKSMYFAAQSMAAEFSTALLAVTAIDQSERNIALIIVNIKAEFEKKAASKLQFTCEDGERIRNAVNEIQNNGDSSIVEAKSIGKDVDGEIVSIFHVTWSFKDRS